MEFDFPNIKDGGSFLNTPGEYLSRVIGADDKFTTGGFPMIELIYEVMDGPEKGNTFRDNLVLKGGNDKATESCAQRVKLVCSRMGMDITKKFDVTPEIFKDRVVIVVHKSNTYRDKVTNEEKTNTKIPFDGYKLADGVVPVAKERAAGDDFFK